MEKSKLEVLDYDSTDFREWSEPIPENCSALRETPTVSWINVMGLSDLGVVERIGKAFDLHPLVMEDIVNTGQRPKMEEFDDYLFIVIKMLSCDLEHREIHSEQISLVLGKGYVISFQEREGDVFGALRERIRASKGRIRRMGADYLAYSLLDAVVDSYFNVLESMGEHMEEINEQVTGGDMPDAPVRINHLKREILLMRKSVWPMREFINGLKKTESSLFSDEVSHFLRDLYDHTVEMIETVETFRDMLSGLLDLHMSQVSNRMNEVMKTLTIIATIFIPLTFIVGVYGMNFVHMPELGAEMGYPIVWVVMIALAMTMVLYFRRKRWI